MIHRWLRANNLGWHTGVRLIGLGVLMAACALAAPRIPSLTTRLTPNGLDFVCGLSFGLALAFFIIGIAAMLAARKRRDKDGRPPA